MKRTLPKLLCQAGCALGLLAGVSRLAAGNGTNYFHVTGMHCDGCARGIASELKRVAGVTSAEVTFSNKLAVVVCDTNRVSSQALKQTIIDAGYDARPITPPKASRP